MHFKQLLISPILSAYVMLFGTQLGRLTSRLMPRIARSLHTERKVQIQGTGDLHIVECGSGSRSLLLMPGALGSAWTDFRPQIEQLPKLLPDHTIIAWDPQAMESRSLRSVNSDLSSTTTMQRQLSS